MNLFKTKFDAATIVLIPACIGINYLGKMFASLLKLPLWLDSIGTCIGGCLGGPIIGGICGAANNLIYGLTAGDNITLIYALTSLGIGLAAGIMGVAVGIPALRLRGDYLAIVTMAFAEIIRVCFCNFSITGGGKTMSGILKLSTFDRAFWIMVVCVTVMFLFVRSRFGRTVQAIREDYIAASASGINVTYYKVLTFAISAFFAGIGGGVYAHYMTAMIPTNFNFNYSAELLSEVIIGGTGSLTGSIIGAAFLSSLPELMRDFSTYRMLAYSIVLVLVMLFRPGGIFGRWEFSLNRLLDGIHHPKEKAAKGA